MPAKTTALAPTIDAPTIDPDTAAQHQSCVDGLRAIHRQSYVRYALDSAQVLLDHWFAGDIANFTSRDRTKTASLESFLKARKDDLAEMSLSRDTLRTFLRARAVAPSLSPEVRERLEVTKMAKLVALPSPEAQQRLGAEALKAGWNRSQLAKAVHKATGKKPPLAKGRPAHPALLKAAQAARDAALKVGRYRTAYDNLAPEHRAMASAALVDAVAALQQALAHIQTA